MGRGPLSWGIMEGSSRCVFPEVYHGGIIGSEGLDTGRGIAPYATERWVPSLSPCGVTGVSTLTDGLMYSPSEKRWGVVGFYVIDRTVTNSVLYYFYVLLVVFR